MIERKVNLNICKISLPLLWVGVGLLVFGSLLATARDWRHEALMLANWAGVVAAIAGVQHVRYYFVKQSTLMRALRDSLGDSDSDDDLAEVRSIKYH